MKVNKILFPDIKICPERIYHLAFHPVADKQLVFAADKVPLCFRILL